MNWLFPGFLAGATLIALPVVLHFLRRRQNVTVRFPSLRFLGETALRDTRRHQLRRWLTLLLRCLAIALLAAAFARPFFTDAAARHRQAMVVALDNSMSMQAEGRWKTCQDWALAQIANLAPGDRAAVLVMNPSPSWLVPMTDNLGAVRAAIKNARPGFEKTHYDAALRAAGSILAAQSAGTKTLVWAADEQRVGWLGMDLKQTLPPGVKLHLAQTLPEPTRQSAIVTLQKSSSHPGLIATVRLYQPNVDQRRVVVRDGNKVLQEKMISLHTGDNRVELNFAWPTNAAGLRVSLDPDNLPADDTAWIATEKPAATKVLLDKVTGEDFLAQALNSTEKLGRGALQPATLSDGEWPVDSVVILRGTNVFRPPQVSHLNHFFDAGGALWIFGNGSPDQTAWLRQHDIQLTSRRADTGPWHLRDWDPEHPALAAFAGQSLLPLLDVEFNHGFDLTSDELAPLANWPDGQTAIAEWNNGGHRLLIAGFAADRTDMNWPTQPSFVPFVHGAVRWLGSVGSARSDWRVGDLIPLPGPGRWRALDALSPPADQMVNGGLRATTPGLYEFSSGDLRKIFAVNIAPEESNLSPWPQPEQLAALQSKQAVHARAEHALPLSDTTAENHQRLWWWTLAICGVVLLSELALANRTAL